MNYVCSALLMFGLFGLQQALHLVLMCLKETNMLAQLLFNFLCVVCSDYNPIRIRDGAKYLKENAAHRPLSPHEFCFLTQLLLTSLKPFRVLPESKQSLAGQLWRVLRRIKKCCFDKTGSSVGGML